MRTEFAGPAFNTDSNDQFSWEALSPSVVQALTAAKPSCGAAAVRPWRSRRSLFLVLVLAALLSGCISRAAAKSEQGEIVFERYEVIIGSAERQTVLTGFFLGGGVAELAVVNVDENDDRRLRMFAFDGSGWAPELEAILRPEVLFVDVANVGGRDRLLTYELGRLNWFDPESATERALVAVPYDHEGKAPRRRQIPHVDVTRDVNGDGRDDLVVPASLGFWVFVQMEGGAFADPVKLGTSTEMRRKAEMSLTHASDGYRYDPWSHSRVHEMDYDRDGRRDLVFWNGDRFVVHRQDENGLFSPEAKTFTADVAFDSDGFYSIGLDAHGEKWTALHALGDLNGDGAADLVALSPEGASVRVTWSEAKSLVIIGSNYEVHFGKPTPEGSIVFAGDADARVQSEGVQMDMIRQHDFDGDGQMDMMLTTGKFSLLKLIRALLGGSVPLDLQFYRMEGGVYPDQPNATRRIRADAPPWGDKFYPSVLIGDVNGDRRLDLLVQKGRKELHVFVGVPGPELFAERPRKVAVVMPKHQEYTWLADLNNDGKQDVFMHHPSAAKPHRLTMLMAR